MRALVDEYREFAPVLAEHLDDNDGELLPHLVLADIMRWLATHVDTDRETCRSVLARLEKEYVGGAEDVRGLITVSGVEMIPDPGQPGAALRDLLGPTLKGIDPWSGHQ
jgi:hypothetical protein